MYEEYVSNIPQISSLIATTICVFIGGKYFRKGKMWVESLIPGNRMEKELRGFMVVLMGSIIVGSAALYAGDLLKTHLYSNISDLPWILAAFMLISLAYYTSEYR